MIPAKQAPQLIDLVSFCRDSAIETDVYMFVDYQWVLWIKLGQIQLMPQPGDVPSWQLKAYAGFDHDESHDSSYLLSMALVGVELTNVQYGVTIATAWIRGDDGDRFMVPDQSWNPRQHPDAHPCRDRFCLEEEHYVDHYVVPGWPPANPLLFAQVSSSPVKIVTGVNGTHR
jgi:hypothetical protein